SLPRRRWRRRRLYLVWIQVTIARRRSSRVSQRRVSRTFFCSNEKKLSMAALSPEDPTRPIDPFRPLFFKSRWTFLERNWLRRSEGQIVPSASGCMIALRIAEADSEDFIRESIESPTIRPEQQSLNAHRYSFRSPV